MLELIRVEEFALMRVSVVEVNVACRSGPIQYIPRGRVNTIQ